MEHVQGVLGDEDITTRARVVLISFVRHDLETWQSERAGIEPDKQALVLVDEARAAYAAFGLRRGSTWEIWHPRVLWHYVRRVARGETLFALQDDPDQLGGDFVVAADGQSLLLSHPSQTPVDRPTLEQIRDALRDT
jgi:hypothetical protein